MNATISWTASPMTFAYRQNIPAWSFLMAGLSMIAIALATISFQCAKLRWSIPRKV